VGTGGFVIDDAHAAIGGPVHPVDVPAHAKAVALTPHDQRRLALEPKGGLVLVRKKVPLQFRHRLHRAAHVLHDLGPRLRPPGRLPEPLLPGGCVQDPARDPGQRLDKLRQVGRVGNLLVELFEDTVVDVAQLPHVQPLAGFLPWLQVQDAPDEEEKRADAVGLQAARAPGVAGAEALGEPVGQAAQVAVEWPVLSLSKEPVLSDALMVRQAHHAGLSKDIVEGTAGRVALSQVENVGGCVQRRLAARFRSPHPLLDLAAGGVGGQTLHQLGPGGDLP
jgi:hypothetical protein